MVDNTPDKNQSGSLPHLSDSDIELIRNGENLGVGEALNQGLAKAIKLGYRWVITFDQDSWANEDLVATLIAIYKQQPRTENVGVVGCNFEDENLHTSPIRHDIGAPNFSETVTVITSGSLMSTEVFSKVGPFRSDFFIDFIDHEYCLRLRKLGYSVLTATAPLMVHALGEATKLGAGKGFGKFSLVLTNRSPLRRYYMTRNGLLVVRTYLGLAPIFLLRIATSILFFSILKIPLEKTHRWKKVVATLYGALDALRAKTGRMHVE
jgi:rhamnosyltransferase